MATNSQDILLNILMKVAGGEQLSKMSKALGEASNGTLSLGKNLKIYEKGTVGAISATKALDIAGKNLAKTSNAKTAATIASAKADEAATRAKRALERANQDATRAFRGANQVTKDQTVTAGAATFALTSLGQGFADAGQFGNGFAQGMRAITNNAQQTVFAMTMLVGQTKTFGATISALKSVMTGPLGFLFAFQAISAALEGYSSWAQRANKHTKELKDALEGMLEIYSMAKDDKPITITIDEALQIQAAVNKALIDTARAKKEAGANFSRGFISKQEYENTIANLRDVRDSAERIGEINDKKIDKIKEQSDNQRLLNEYIDDEAVAQGLRLLAIEKANAAELDFLANISRLAKDAEDLPDVYIDVGEALETFNDVFDESIRRQRESIGQLTTDLARLSGADGARIAQLDIQEARLRSQIDHVKTIQALLAAGLPGSDEVKKILGLGPEENKRLVNGKYVDSEPTDKLFVSSNIDAIIQDGEKYQEAQGKIVDANQRLRDSFSDLGADLLIAGASIGGGLDGLQRTFGSFLASYGAELVKMGMSTVALGVSMKAVKTALESLNGPVAIAAGLALVAAGSALKAQGKSSAKALSGGGSSGGSRGGSGTFAIAPNVFAQQGVVGNSFFTPGYPTTTRIEVRGHISGRDIYLANDMESRSRSRMGVN